MWYAVMWYAVMWSCKLGPALAFLTSLTSSLDHGVRDHDCGIGAPEASPEPQHEALDALPRAACKHGQATLEDLAPHAERLPTQRLCAGPETPVYSGLGVPEASEKLPLLH